MRSVRSLVTMIVVLSVGRCVAAEPEIPAKPDSPVNAIDQIRRQTPHPPVRIAMHRGAKRHAPENTWPAIDLARRLGADYIEIDIHTTADGRHVLLHDRQLDRTTSGHGPVNQQPLAEILKLDAGSWFATEFAGTSVPVLEECIERILAAERAPPASDAPPRAPVHFYLDAKAIAPEALAAVISQYGLEERSVVFQGPSYLAKVRAANPQARLMPPLYAAASLDKLADDLRPFAVDVRWEALSKELIDRCHARGIQVFSDAIGDHERPEDYLQAIDWGIDVIQTDEPLRLWQAIEAWRRRNSAK